MTNKQAPIGVYDSGVGGLSVLQAIHAQLPSENTIYLRDQAKVPYGERLSKKYANSLKASHAG